MFAPENRPRAPKGKYHFSGEFMVGSNAFPIEIVHFKGDMYMTIGKSPGNTSSNPGFSIVMLVFVGYTP